MKGLPGLPPNYVRGLKIVEYVLNGLQEAGSDPKNKKLLGRERLHELTDTLIAEALPMFPAESAPRPQQQRCGSKDCQCTHDLDPFTGLRCEGGWLTPAEGAAVQTSLFGDAPVVADPRLDPKFDQVTACPTCAPERARILDSDRQRPANGAERAAAQTEIRGRNAR